MADQMSERPPVDQNIPEQQQVVKSSRRNFLRSLGALTGLGIAATVEQKLPFLKSSSGVAKAEEVEVSGMTVAPLEAPAEQVIEPQPTPETAGVVAGATVEADTEALFFNFQLKNIYEDHAYEEFKRRIFTPDQIQTYEGVQVKGPKEFQDHVKKILDAVKLDSTNYVRVKGLIKSLEFVDGPSANWLDRQRGPIIGVNDIYGDGGYGMSYDPELNPNFIINSTAELVRDARYTELVEQGNPMARVRLRSASGPIMTPELSSLYTQANIEGAKAVKDFVVTIKQPQGIIDYYERRLALAVS